MRLINSQDHCVNFSALLRYLHRVWPGFSNSWLLSRKWSVGNRPKHHLQKGWNIERVLIIIFQKEGYSLFLQESIIFYCTDTGFWELEKNNSNSKLVVHTALDIFPVTLCLRGNFSQSKILICKISRKRKKKKEAYFLREISEWASSESRLQKCTFRQRPKGMAIIISKKEKEIRNSTSLSEPRVSCWRAYD